ncbi:hypothetical protein NX059_011116 [Plenodomus lindquistii]|nr:hypothetical protein NX059_011116 [Plenodomus lindquistii]
MYDAQHRSPLSWTCSEGSPKVFRKILRWAGGDGEKEDTAILIHKDVDDRGWTPFHHAIASNRLDILQAEHVFFGYWCKSFGMSRLGSASQIQFLVFLNDARPMLKDLLTSLYPVFGTAIWRLQVHVKNATSAIERIERLVPEEVGDDDKALLKESLAILQANEMIQEVKKELEAPATPPESANQSTSPPTNESEVIAEVVDVPGVVQSPSAQISSVFDRREDESSPINP